MENSDTVNFIVGGVYYSLLLSDIKAHEDCYFASAIKDEWNNSDEPIVIDRDGALFQHIFVYMYNSRYQFPFVVNGSLSLLLVCAVKLITTICPNWGLRVMKPTKWN